jgi:hypothetical protein
VKKSCAEDPVSNRRGESSKVTGTFEYNFPRFDVTGELTVPKLQRETKSAQKHNAKGRVYFKSFSNDGRSVLDSKGELRIMFR